MSKEADNINSGAEYGGTLWERRQRDQENAILDAANALINERGFDAMTMDDLAERAGISKPTLYKRFPSKETVAVRATLQIIEDGLAEIYAHPKEWTAEQRFIHIVDWTLRKCMMGKRVRFGSAKALLVPVIRANPEYRRLFDEMTSVIQKIVEAAQSEGVIDSRLNSRLVTQLMFSLVRDSDYEELITTGVCSPQETADTLTTLILRGVRAESKAG